ncbi:para-nitrobenzyl esterase [Phlyctema vagabunda]|uniref:Para-nitrobenzyl esterase n=1 Tax=Phlyctema vagabunda TaxID=108571 RepID=A0ABR4P9S4_9HELO
MSIKRIHHPVPSLDSTIIGELDDARGLALFRGIPYATVEKRWTHSQTRHSLDSPYDATNFGPRCVQTVRSSLVTTGAVDPETGDDEFKCLNLNVTVFRDVLYGNKQELLPVMVWIHGGAFTHGANSVSRYRPELLCELAKEFGNQVVIVQINYRLGPLGYAATKDFEAEQDADSPSLGNFGLYDQRNALEWVQAHISDFGGDPDNVTAFGVSAGSASIHHHILSGSPLFDRAILMSGTAPNLGPVPLEMLEMVWKGFVKSSGVKEDDPVKRLEKLRALEPMDVLNKYSPAALASVADGKFLPKNWSMYEKQDPTRCKSIILGDSRVEGIIFDSSIARADLASFRKLVESVLSGSEATRFYEVFGFATDTAEMPDDEFRDAMRFLMSVMMFQYPNLEVAATYPEAYLYHFEEPSPFPGATLGLPYHGMCAFYLHQTVIDNDLVSEGGKATAREMGRIWSGFAHGKQPWEVWASNQKFMRFGPHGSALHSTGDDQTRSYAYLEQDWLKEHFEQVKTIVGGVLNGLKK